MPSSTSDEQPDTYRKETRLPFIPASEASRVGHIIGAFPRALRGAATDGTEPKGDPPLLSPRPLAFCLRVEGRKEHPPRGETGKRAHDV